MKSTLFSPCENCMSKLSPGGTAARLAQIRFEKRLASAATLYGTVALSFVIPSVPLFPTSPLSPAATYVVLPKENHMLLTEAATLDRKSGEAEGSAVPRTSPGKREILYSNNIVISTGAYPDFLPRGTGPGYVCALP